MKSSRRIIHRKTHALPGLRFEEQQLTSFSGLVVVQQLFSNLDLKERLRGCFRHLDGSPIFGHASVVLLLIVHLLLGYRELRQIGYYRDDPMVKRLLGLSRLPDVATISRALAGADDQSVERLRRLLGEMVLVRLEALGVARVTLDFDGSVIGTGRYAEGTAVGFNRKKKGQRSYYPLLCTVAQTGQVLDVLHRSGNVHDSNGAQAFILGCIAALRTVLPRAAIEVRMDAAFFSDTILSELEAAGVEYTVSVPFDRLVALKQYIETRRRWRRLDAGRGYFERRWKAKSWQMRRRLLFIRTETRRQHKAPVQLDLLVPYEYGHEFKAIITNKRLGARKVLEFHNGRGAQEGIFAELKSDNQIDYVPTRTWLGNQIYLLSALFAHNLARELQMIAHAPSRRTLEKRPALWDFPRLDTLRRTLIQRAGRLIRPQGQLTLSMSANSAVKEQMLHYLHALGCPA
jgi:hypothetical protein